MSDTLRRSGKKSLPEQRMTRINQTYMGLKDSMYYLLETPLDKLGPVDRY